MSLPNFLRNTLAAMGVLLITAGCGDDNQPTTAPDSAATQKPLETYQWKMVTNWPKNFPGLGVGANKIAENIEAMSGGRIKIKVYGAGELIGAFETFDAVSRGTAELGHGGAYYWKGKLEAAQFFSTVPFGFTAQEMNAWLYYGGGLELWQELYQPFNLVPFPAGNTGVQMAGWFNKEINTLEDLKGLKIRMPGIGGEVMTRAGATTLTLPGGEIYTSLQSGNIDATEWVGPYNDQAFGLHEVAKYYYYPGWHEPGTALELIINKDAWESLPKDLQAIIATASQAANTDMLAEFTARNQRALNSLLNDHNVQLRQLPVEVLQHLRKLSLEVLQEIADRDPRSQKVYQSFQDFYQQVLAWHNISEQAYMAARSRPKTE